jgi:hypothetical protein
MTPIINGQFSVLMHTQGGQQQKPSLQIELFGFDAHFALFQLARAGDDANANHRR